MKPMLPSTMSVLILCGAPAHTLHADSEYLITSSPPEILTAAGAELATEHYRVNQWGFVTTSTQLSHDVWYYPTENDRNEAGVFTIDAHKARQGDFDGDGDMDMMINWTPMPFTVATEGIMPTILINENGNLHPSSDIWETPAPARIFAYKIHVQDFNLDGADDAVSATMGRHTRLQGGGFDFAYEPIPLIMSTANGLVDATEFIEGQEVGLLSGFTFAHDLASGDINGDGFFDFYEGRNLFLGNGAGAFVRGNDLLPDDASFAGSNPHFVMSSAMGDLDNDGLDDLVIGLADGQAINPPQSGWIFLSNGSGGLRSGTARPLPAGHYGLTNTKHNSMTLADINGDGRLDILIGQTQANPYYHSRNIQLLVNQGNGNFVDESLTRLQGAERSDAHGEGPVQVMDVNGDGYPDIVDSAAGKPEDVAILINNGSGHFTRMPSELLPIIQYYHMVGWEYSEGETYGISNTSKVYPIDLHGNGIVSFVVQMQLPPENWPPQPGDRSRSILYVIEPTTPYAPVAGESYLSDQECLLQWAASNYPDLFPANATVDGRLEAYRYRHFISTNSFIALRGKRVLVYRPDVSPAIQDMGSIDTLLPLIRNAACR